MSSSQNLAPVSSAYKASTPQAVTCKRAGKGLPCYFSQGASRHKVRRREGWERDGEGECEGAGEG